MRADRPTLIPITSIASVVNKTNVRPARRPPARTTPPTPTEGPRASLGEWRSRGVLRGARWSVADHLGRDASVAGDDLVMSPVAEGGGGGEVPGAHWRRAVREVTCRARVGSSVCGAAVSPCSVAGKAVKGSTRRSKGDGDVGLVAGRVGLGAGVELVAVHGNAEIGPAGRRRQAVAVPDPTPAGLGRDVVYRRFCVRREEGRGGGVERSPPCSAGRPPDGPEPRAGCLGRRHSPPRSPRCHAC
ncbi:hypothetical protein FHR81_004657 [Actinoalloteichus hoggarensis]|uniref:Uncharacterized protein n=1 Tax=Actinoalloteichus hoggarensis TaxID=1470176 RepID=A0A221W4G4_9PSEU|nr:hypothetical protein AHOG_14520 [Actinoalloteichus hoggarensis]MBB5923586.1 hypothetical protein [Actinoalloteichus hoggarensis]